MATPGERVCETSHASNYSGEKEVGAEAGPKLMRAAWESGDVTATPSSLLPLDSFLTERHIPRQCSCNVLSCQKTNMGWNFCALAVFLWSFGCAETLHR